MNILLSHPTGNANVRAAAKGLEEAGLLSDFRTSIASFPDSFIDNIGALGPLAEIHRRRFDSKLAALTRTRPWLEIGRLISTKAGLNRLIRHEKGIFSIDAVYRDLDEHVSRGLINAVTRGVDSVYAYEDGAAISFKTAKSLNLECLYDLPIGYWRTAKKLLEKERLTNPEWASTLTGFMDSNIKLARKDEELQLADRIFVASRFTANTLKDFPGTLAPVEVIPYGFPEVKSKKIYSTPSIQKPLKLLFVGGLSQRKGISYLFKAIDSVSRHVELTVVGRKASTTCVALDVALTKHRWIPSLPHAEILKLMQTQDVLIFPSLFEGFGLVITEAMSQGIPVITTDRTAGPDLIVNDENGWLIEAGATEALIIAIEKLLLKPELIKKSGQAAMQTALHRPWEVYGRELAEAIQKHKKP
jgi:glycosyltransferase involved in cell wall biosynthesis